MTMMIQLGDQIDQWAILFYIVFADRPLVLC